MRAFVSQFFKCIMLAAFWLVPVSMLQAQTDKGKMIIGGSVDISDAIQNTTSNFNFSIAPSFGAFVINNLGLGGSYSLTVGSQRVLNNDQSHTTTTTFNTGVGPFIRYYFGKKMMKPFVSANGGYAVHTVIRSVSTSSSSSLTNYDGFTMGASVGLAYFLNPHLSLQSALYISTSGYQTQIPTTRFGFSFGLYAFLDKKKQE